VESRKSAGLRYTTVFPYEQESAISATWQPIGGEAIQLCPRLVMIEDQHMKQKLNEISSVVGLDCVRERCGYSYDRF
jgi:hypothetical protein